MRHLANEGKNPPRTSSALSILIVGGGIAGLSMALFLERIGLRAEIAERAGEPNGHGGGITLTLNGVRILNELGLGALLEAKGTAINTIDIADRNDRKLTSFDLRQYNRRYAQTMSIHRSSLHKLLSEGLTSTNLRFNTSITSIQNEEGKVKATFNSERSEYYDLAIGCDGMNSSLREYIFNRAYVKYAGYACWRFVAEDCEEVATSAIKEMWGRGKRFGIVPLSNNRIHCFASVNAVEASTKYRSISIEGFKQLFRDFKGCVPQLLNKLYDEKQLHYTELGDVNLDSWINGRVVLIGDAAHGMTPNMAQGASMALEDAKILAQHLSDTTSVEEALLDFFVARRRRVNTIQKRSKRLGKIGQLESRLFCGLRNFGWRHIPDSWIQRDFERILV